MTRRNSKDVTLQIEIPGKLYELLKVVARRDHLGTRDYAKLGLFLLMEGQIDDSYRGAQRARYMKVLRSHWKRWAGGSDARMGRMEGRRTN